MATLPHIQWTNNKIWINGILSYSFEEDNDALSICTQLYKDLELAYPKFFKMDIISKAGFLATELLLKYIDEAQLNRDKTAIYISTKDGCIDVDQKFQNSMATVASPALFVYTLPNIVLGEICIRQKFKGEQMCYVSAALDKEDLRFYLQDIFLHRNQEHCLCGSINATEHTIDIALYMTDPNNYQLI